VGGLSGQRSEILASLADGELVAGTLQDHSRGHRVDHSEMDVELCAKRGGRQTPEQVRPAGSRWVRRDRLRDESLAECQPVRSGAVVVHVRIRRPLAGIAVVRSQVPHPDVEVDDLVGPFPTWIPRPSQTILKRSWAKGKVVCLESDGLLVVNRRERVLSARTDRGQLAAGGLDVAPSRESDGRRQACAIEYCLESGDPLRR